MESVKAGAGAILFHWLVPATEHERKKPREALALGVWVQEQNMDGGTVGGQGWEGVGEEVTGSGRKLAGAGNPSDSSLCVGYVSHLCSELGPRGALG